jgi:hypothetical protein
MRSGKASRDGEACRHACLQSDDQLECGRLLRHADSRLHTECLEHRVCERLLDESQREQRPRGTAGAVDLTAWAALRRDGRRCMAIPLVREDPDAPVRRRCHGPECDGRSGPTIDITSLGLSVVSISPDLMYGPYFSVLSELACTKVAMNATAHSISGRITGDTSLVATGGMPMRVQFALSRGAGARPIGSLGMVSDRSRPFEPFDPRPRNAALHDGRRRENRVGSPGMAVLYCRWHLDCAKLFQWRLPPRILVAVNRFEMPQELQKCRSCARNVSPNRGGRPL